MANGNDIIIKGGSVEFEYDDSLYPKEPGSSKKHKSKDKNLKIVRITVLDENGVSQYDTGAKERELKWEIKAHCR